jgi:hypothetical protein
MTSESEDYLTKITNSAFLKPWTIPNPFFRVGKEISDVLVPFGKDVILFSDKACRFNIDADVEISWSRWKRAAIDESIKQLKGAVRRLDMPNCTIFTDHKAQVPLAFDVPPPNERTYHLIAVVRPDRDPNIIPAGWHGLRYSDETETTLFQIGPRFVGNHFVHVFDGATIEHLLNHFDTGPDFIAYLKSRAAVLATRPGVSFRELDLLSLATLNWMNGEGFTLSLDAAEKKMLSFGLWEVYSSSDRALHTRQESGASKVIDRLIQHFHDEYLSGRNANTEKQDHNRHEEAMRHLASEDRFARRAITASLKSILDEAEQHTFWASTVPSPSHARVRYVWLAYPKKPSDWTEKYFEEFLQSRLAQYLLVAGDTFKPEILIGFAVPNRSADDNLLLIQILDASIQNEETKSEAAWLRDNGIFRDLEAEHSIHVP